MSQRIATMDGVHEYGGDRIPELWVDDDGNLVVACYFDTSHATELNLVELLGWLRLHIKQGNPVGDKVMAMLPELERQYSV